MFGNDNSIDRLENFIKNTKTKDVKNKDTIEELFNESVNLVFKYLSYYNKKRLSKKFSTNAYRTSIWFFGFIGLALPIVGTSFKFLIDKIAIIDSSNLLEFGYGFIMLTAVLVAMKNYTGATKGHIRYITTQLKLEKIIANSIISWNKTTHSINCAENEQELTADDCEKLYAVINQLLESSYAEIMNEIKRWGKDIKDDESEFIVKHLSSAKNKENNDKTN